MAPRRRKPRLFCVERFTDKKIIMMLHTSCTLSREDGRHDVVRGIRFGKTFGINRRKLLLKKNEKTVFLSLDIVAMLLQNNTQFFYFGYC